METLHGGITPATKTGVDSDARVIDADSREIQWPEISRIDQDEMKTFIIGVVDRLYSLQMRTLFSPSEDIAFAQALDSAALSWTREWDSTAQSRSISDVASPVTQLPPSTRAAICAV